MDELVKLLVQKTGMSEDMARKAADTVIGYLKQKLPAPVAGQVDAALAGGGVSGAIGGMFGKK
jgi:hypothetical protein